MQTRSKYDGQNIASGRSGARELAMMLFFQMDAQNDFGDEIKTAFFNENLKKEEQRSYVEQIYGFGGTHLTAVDEFIESCSDNWKVARIGKVDLATLRVAILEIMFMDDIPQAVSVNEAVNIAKKYGTEDSGKFVNGILGKVVKVINENK
jgi:N utilization substance protein B